MLKLCTTVFVVSLTALFSARSADDAPIKPEDAQSYLDLTVKLGSDDFTEREDAQRKLHAAPFGAFDVLRKALAQSRDAEVQDQLRSVLIGLAFNFCGKSRGFKISLKASNTPLQGVLENVARQMGLEADTFSSILPHATLARLVSVEFDEMEDRFAVRWLFRLANVEPRTPVHPVDGSYELADLPVKPATLACLFKDRWMAADFQNPGSLSLDGSRLSVHASSDVHEKIATIIEQLKEQTAQKNSNRIAISFDADAPLRVGIDTMLQKNKVSFDLVNTPLAEAVEQIGKNASIPILIDPRIVSAGPAPITLRVSDMSAKTALEWLAKLSNTCVSYKDHGLWLTTPDNRGGQQCLILNLDEMIHAPGHHSTLAAVADMLRQRVRPDLWDAALGTSVEEQDNRLIIMQYPEVVAQIGELLDCTSRYIALCKKVEKNGQWPDHPLDPADVPVEEPPKSSAPPWIEDLKTKLTTKISFDYDAKPLAEVLDAISKAASATIIVDPRMTADGTSQTPITLRVKDMDAQHALQWVLKLADLDFELRESVVFVSRKANMAGNYTLGMYYVRDLNRVLGIADLVTLLHDRLLAADFADPCTSIAENDGALFVMQRPEIHQQFRFMLMALRLNWKDKTIMLCPLAIEDTKEADSSKLFKKVACQFKDATLPDVLKTLQEQSDLAIELDPNLKEALGKSTVKLNLSLPNATLLEALVHTLEPWHLGFALKAGALVVSPTPQNLVNVPLAIYSLDGIKNKTAAQIADLVKTTIDPQSWDAALGTCLEERNGKLIVMQSPEKHRQIAALLEKLRKEPE